MSMSKINKIIFAKAICAFFSCILACLSFPALAAELPSPAVTTSDFYKWYIHSLVANHQPLSDEKVKLGTYVSKSLIAEIEKRMNSEDGLDADYFIQAQDYFDDWEKNISVTKSRISGNTATVRVTLGASKESIHHLELTLKKEDSVWKIRRVRPL
ncbi:DUF3828 domain-containing protein [Massilia rubra]|uniref:DUF3828 domain-containing protein n=1 Tax=Massilia rubra TaxID=2607910 RepID=A0ABX0LT96_9BURK|nr:DUF3828 domain-containing protein [Massilia rubra]NHZ34624.1 DUF3828 domain-containing protein [Massilia rubra]